MSRKVVVYCDGSSRPNPGPTGWGAHGYTYLEHIPKPNKAISFPGWYYSATGYTNKAQIDTHIEPLDVFDLLGALDNPSTNNRAEVHAVKASLNYLLNQYSDLHTVSLILDSQYVLKGITEYMKTWEKNDWKTATDKEPANLDTWKELNTLLKLYKEKNIQLDFQWVKSHSDNFGNDRADKLALIARNMSQMNHRSDYTYTHTPLQFKQHLNMKESNLFLNFKRLFFSDVADHNLRGLYLLSNSDTEKNELGRKSTQVSYAIAKLREPHPIIEDLRQHYTTQMPASHSVVTIKLDRVFSSDVYPYLHNYGMNATILSKENQTLCSLDNEALVYRINPPLLSMKAIHNFNALDELLESYERGQLAVSEYRDILRDRYTVYEITDHFYETTAKGKTTFRKELAVGTKHIDLDVTVLGVESKFKMLLGKDLPDRNYLKRMESITPRIFCIFWLSADNLLQCAYLIDTTEGKLICSSFFSVPVIEVEKC